MANLRNFIWSGSHDGMALDLYLNRTPKVGSGTLLVAQPLRVALEAKATVFGTVYSGTVEIRMPDESPRGTCTVVLNGVQHDRCPYRIDGGYLKIQAAGREVSLGDHDQMWTWLGVSQVPAWIGLWPASTPMPEDEAERELAAPPA